jgi:single-strand DNA-binding protein
MTTTPAPTGSRAEADGPAHRNDVHLVGRLAAPAEARELPSGDTVVTFRLVVAREPTRRRGARSPTVDTVDCAAWLPAVQRSVTSYRAGDVLEVTGALRRRFWRGAGGPASRTEVEVVSTRRRSRAGAPP